MAKVTRAARFDVAPFSLPGCVPGEIRFEEAREIFEVVVQFRGSAPDDIGLSYLRKYWPDRQPVEPEKVDNPCGFGWVAIDDWFNCSWHRATVDVRRETRGRVSIIFRPAGEEFAECACGDVTYRWTLGVRIEVPDTAVISKIQVYTTSDAATTRLRVRLDAGQMTPCESLSLEGYNAVIQKVIPIDPATEVKNRVSLPAAAMRAFELHLKHMAPARTCNNDDGLVTFDLGEEKFTISLPSLLREGPIWFADRGVFITSAGDPITFEDYESGLAGAATIAERVALRPEQSYAGARNGQPAPHPVSYNLGCKHARQRFWLEPSGDVLLNHQNVTRIPARDTERYKNRASARFFFGLQSWQALARYPDPAPVLVYNQSFRRGALKVDQRSLAVPLLSPIGSDDLSGDDIIVALVRFRFTNEGAAPVVARLPICYSQDSRREHNGLSFAPNQDDHLVPQSEMDPLRFDDGQLLSPWHERWVMRCTFDSSMEPQLGSNEVALIQELAPGHSCEVVLKIPFVSLENEGEFTAMEWLSFDQCEKDVAHFWRQECRKGAQLRVPEEPLVALHRSHLMHVQVTDFEMPDGSGLINTSVGTSTYGNFSNESCMIVHELDQRGLHEEARRRLELWVRYQGTVPQPGNFTDCNGMYFGAGGFEEGAYNQHHGWVLWCLCEHYFLTRDTDWFRRIAPSVVAGAEWVFRQRRGTMQPLPHSRGWEHGFLPAGSLEDVTDFFYWLSTNSLTWRGTEWAARALESIEHPEAHRLRCEADAYRDDLIRGFETMRQHSPLVRLRNGRWVPHYPSRLYRRGRDTGWIRELLEGAVYLLISGLYDAESEQARWILDDYQDTRYPDPPYGYRIDDFENTWFARGGFSIQPNLLAGLLPYLDRDEPAVYIWMFYNAWAACYREQINAMIEHPAPVLGYSNSAHFKTSDEANAVMWLRYMIVYCAGDVLHVGRAIPRAWLRDGETVSLSGAKTPFGAIGVRYVCADGETRIVAEIDLALDRQPGRILVRFRHPRKAGFACVVVNGTETPEFDSATGDVDVTGLAGRVVVEARFAV